MKILVIGGTGFISGRTVQKLIEEGHHVTIFTRGKSQNLHLKHLNLNYVIGDRHDKRKLKETLHHGRFDVVYDFVAYEPRESKLAVDVFQGNIGRFIHCSTISIYMVSNEIQCPITEDQDKRPLMPFWKRNPFGMDYGIKKRQCEDILWQAHNEQLFPVSMLRPTYVSGPNDPTRRDFFWIERILDGKPLLIPGSGDFAFQSVFVDDVAQAFVELLNFDVTIGHAYNVVGEDIFSLNDYLKSLSRLLHRTPQLVHIDQEVFDRLSFNLCPDGDVFPFNTRRTAIFSMDKIKRDLNYRSTPFHNWMTVTIDWYLNKYEGHSNGYEKRAEEIEFIQRWKNIKSKFTKEIIDT